MNERLFDMLKRHEGVKLRPYRDRTGHLSIGCGRNLDARGVGADEVMLMLKNDVIMASAQCASLHCWEKLDDVRRDVLVDMCFNLGFDGLKGFKRMLAAIEFKDWHEARAQMLASRWATQVGDRAAELADMMLTGTYRGK